MATKQTEPVTVISLRKLSLGTPEPQQKEPKTFTVEEAVETIGFGRFHIALFLIMGSTGVVEAMEIMLIAVVSPVIRCEWQLENWQVALVTTMVFFGYMVFSIVFGLLADRYGRWKILLISFLWGAYFSLLTSFSPSYIWFVFLRTMVGCGVSGHAQGLIIKTEFLPTKYRGYMLPLSQVFWLAGSLLIIGLASVVIPTIGWRWLIRIASIPGIILIMAFKFIPESARFNVSTGNTQAAMTTLESIAKMNRSAMPEGKLAEPILEKRGRFADLLDAKYLRTTLQIWVIWLGISFAYYGVILASAELLERDLVCGSQSELESEVVVTLGDTEGSQSPCHCHMFAPSDYRTMIISTIGEIARLPHDDACFGDGDQRLPVSHWCNGGTIYIPGSYECINTGGPVSFLIRLCCVCHFCIYSSH
ncbi:putative transporter SVOPL isoform X3 [Equus asinus]|uniref:putative transporter SVOPL isoform X3 n=1 Tax=Equus asinus TaxID=9793 RepID=UPI0038F68B18